MARCPAHEDNSPSLAISESENGAVLLKCHSGCTTDAVVTALGLTMRDLFPRVDVDTFPPRSKKSCFSSTANGKHKTFPSAAEAIVDLEMRLGKRSATWMYHDAYGNPVGVIVRWDKNGGKGIRPVAKIDDAWAQCGMPTPRSLYRLPDLLKSSGLVYVVEGEKAADALAALSFTVTTSAHGAQSAKGTDWAPLAGRDVAILPDNDDAGTRYAESVIGLLTKLTPKPSIKIVDLPGLPVNGDVVDFIVARKGHSLEYSAIRAEIEKLTDEAEQIAPGITESGIAKSEQPAMEAVLVALADVDAEPVKWLWPGRVALGKVTLIAGDPGLGKSFVTMDMAARVSSGLPWPDAPTVRTTAGGVVLLSAEDDISDTVRPRLDAAGADVKRIVALQAVRHNYKEKPREMSFSLETDLPALEAAILAVPGCRLVIIDPITAYLGGTDSHKNAEIRSLIAPLSALAAKHNVAVVFITHLNKSANGPAIYRAIGSIAFAAAARAVWAVSKDAENPRRRLMLPAKNNLAPDALGLAYTIEPNGQGGSPVVAWEADPVNLTADDALQTESGKDEGGDSRQAQAWLRAALKDGPISAADALAQGKANGFTHKLLRNALNDLGGASKKSSFGGGWLWSLPSTEDASPSEWESSASSQKIGECSSEGESQEREHSQDSQPRGMESSDDDAEWEEVT